MVDITQTLASKVVYFDRYGQYWYTTNSSSTVTYAGYYKPTPSRTSYSSYPHSGKLRYKTLPFNETKSENWYQKGVYTLNHNRFRSGLPQSQSSSQKILGYQVVSTPSGIYPSIDECDRGASSDFYSNLDRMKTMAAVSFAEKQKTIDMVTSTASRIARSLSALRQGRLKEAFGFLSNEQYNPKISKRFNGYKASKNKDIENNWLAYQYGWQPLVQEVYGSMISFHTENPTFWVHGRYEAEFNAQYLSSVVGYTVEGLSKRRVHYKALCSYQPSVLKLHELGLLNPAGIAWELVPYSFVIDWFLPIGDYFSSLSSTIGLTITERSKTDHLYYDITRRTKPTPYSYSSASRVSWVEPGFDAFHKKTRSIKSRVVDVSPPIYAPQFDLSLNTGQLINAIALLSQKR